MKFIFHVQLFLLHGPTNPPHLSKYCIGHMSHLDYVQHATIVIFCCCCCVVKYEQKTNRALIITFQQMLNYGSAGGIWEFQAQTRISTVSRQFLMSGSLVGFGVWCCKVIASLTRVIFQETILESHKSILMSSALRHLKVCIL